MDIGKQLERAIGGFDPAARPPPIGPVPAATARPRWSVMIPVYNCAKFLGRTLESVLSQAPGAGEMEIIVIDDCSTADDPESVVREVGKGRVAFHRKPVNGGVNANFNTCIDRARGELVHILHGDDWVEAGFYQSVDEAMSMYPEAGIAITRSFLTDEEGGLVGLSPALKTAGGTPFFEVRKHRYDNPVLTPAVVVRRSAYEKCGGYLPGLPHTADWEMWERLIGRCGGVFINRALASYRTFGGSDSGKLARRGDNLRDYLRIGLVFRHRDPEFNLKRFVSSVARQAIKQSEMFRHAGDPEAVARNLELWSQIARPREKWKQWWRKF